MGSESSKSGGATGVVNYNNREPLIPVQAIVKNKKTSSKKIKKPKPTTQINQKNKEPIKLKYAKYKAPRSNFYTVIFFWDHLSQSFRFSYVLNKLKNQYPLQKTHYLQYLKEDELIRFDHILRQTKGYSPVEPDKFLFVHLPWLIISIGVIVWYLCTLAFKSPSSNSSNHSDNKQDSYAKSNKGEKGAKHVDDVIAIAMLLFLIGILLVCWRDSVWTNRLIKRQKNLGKIVQKFNDGACVDKQFNFFVSQDELKMKTALPLSKTNSKNKNQDKRHWTANIGLYGAYILFELEEQYKYRQVPWRADSSAPTDGNYVNLVKMRAIDEEAIDSIQVRPEQLAQDAGDVRHAKSMAIGANLVNEDLQIYGVGFDQNKQNSDYHDNLIFHSQFKGQ